MTQTLNHLQQTLDNAVVDDPDAIGPALVSTCRPGRSKSVISALTKRTRSASTSWSGMRTASAARVPAATRGSCCGCCRWGC